VNERPQPSRIATVRVQSRVTVTGVIRSVSKESIAGSPAVRCVLADGSGQIDMLFLGRESVAGLVPGRRCTAIGRACVHRGRMVIWNPGYELEPAAAVPDADKDDGRGAADRVLLIGDDPGLCRVIEVNLAVRGYQVATAPTPAAASSYADRCLSLVIVDLGLAGADGMAPLVTLRGREGRVPVLAVSARGGEDMRRAVLAAGAADFLAKPFPIDDLLVKVQHAAQPNGERRGTAGR
jgi:CheY-like chemotaxis protein